MAQQTRNPSRRPVGGGFTVRRAQPRDLPGARDVLLRVVELDMGGFNPVNHRDVYDLQGAYLDNPRHGLWVAVDDEAGEVLGTAGIKPGGPSSPPHPRWLADRYDPHTTAQLHRVYIAPEHRRRGIAAALVEAARRFVAAEGNYQVICLHTRASVPGSNAFWRAMPTTEIYDGSGTGGPIESVHFELAMPDAEDTRPSSGP